MRSWARLGAGTTVLAILVGMAVPAAAEDVAGSAAATAQLPPAPSHAGLGASSSGSGPKVMSTVRGERLGSAQWGLHAIGAEGAWGITRGAGVTVAVLDSGVDDTHPDLAGRLLPVIDLVGDGRSGDPFGHGTRVAGIIAGVMDGAGIAGAASDVRILPIRVLAAQGEGDQGRTARGVRAAVAAGAQVINLSLSSQTENRSQSDAIRFAVNHGVTVVAAAGNRRNQGSPIAYPAAYPGVVGVSSIGRRLQPSGFASRGTFIDLVAPGERVISTEAGGSWGRADGTSMAAAYVTAGAALVRAANPTLSGAQVDEILLSTAQDVGPAGRDDESGYGVLRVDRAVRAAAGLPGGLPIPSARVTVQSVASGSKLVVDVDPDLTAGAWTFGVERQRGDGSWRPVEVTYRTRGASERRLLDLPRGTYRVRVHSRMGLTEATSFPVTLRR
jgi:subtilisin family serine protease